MLVAWLMLHASTLAAELPEGVVADAEVSEARRHTNGGPALGLTQLAVAGSSGSGLHYGLALASRYEAPLSQRVQLNLLTSAGCTRPRNTVAVAGFAIDVGRWTVQGFRDVSAWVEAGQGRDDHGLRTLGAIFAYTGLTMSFMAVPVLLVASPFASIGHVTAGPTVSWHTDARAPNLFAEVGVGGAMYGDPIDGLPALGWGPLLGVGVQTERNTIALHGLISPPGMHLDGRDARDTMVTGELVVGF